MYCRPIVFSDSIDPRAHRRVAVVIDQLLLDRRGGAPQPTQNVEPQSR
jgi:hypothetical protein